MLVFDFDDAPEGRASAASERGDDAPLSHESFVDVSRMLMQGYSELVGRGMPPSRVADAMLGATINFYDIFGLVDELPDTLRAIAERIEEAKQVS